MTIELPKIALNWIPPVAPALSPRDLAVSRATAKMIMSKVRESYSLKYSDIQAMIKIINQIPVEEIIASIDREIN